MPRRLPASDPGAVGSPPRLGTTMRRHSAVEPQLVAISANYRTDGSYPEILAMIQTITPEIFTGSPMEAAYVRNAPHPEEWPMLIEKLKAFDAEAFAWPEADIAGIAAPTLVVIGDADGIRPEHAVALFRLLGGGVPGDLTGLPKSQLAVLPSETHVSLVMEPADLLLVMITQFLDAPLPAAA